MKLDWKKLWQLFLLKAKFATTSAIASVVDFGVYVFLEHFFLSPVASNVVSYSCGMVINFLLQKRFVFDLQGSVSRAFALSMMVSLGGMALSTGIIYGLSQIPFFNTYQPLTKLCSMGIVFFYNFYLKRYVFERKFI